MIDLLLFLGHPGKLKLFLDVIFIHLVDAVIQNDLQVRCNSKTSIKLNKRGLGVSLKGARVAVLAFELIAYQLR